MAMFTLKITQQGGLQQRCRGGARGCHRRAGQRQICCFGLSCLGFRFAALRLQVSDLKFKLAAFRSDLLLSSIRFGGACGCHCRARQRQIRCLQVLG